MFAIQCDLLLHPIQDGVIWKRNTMGIIMIDAEYKDGLR
jgi:hypothetical protein